MPIVLRGERYRDRENEWLAIEIEKLRAYDYQSAVIWYGTVGKDVFRRWKDVALLGCNDRFFLLTTLMNRPDANHQWLYYRSREVESDPDDYLDLWAREHYKMLRVDEPVPTPSGWVAHGDLKAGDWVFGPDGEPTRVIARTDVFTDGQAFEILFNDGTTIQAGADHLWQVEQKSRNRVRGTKNSRECRKTSILSTLQLSNWLHTADNRLSIQVNSPLSMPAAMLPIAPYTLGAWLGDGHSADSRITCGDAEIFEAIRADGYELSHDHRAADGAETRTVYGLRAKLRGIGVLNDKSIPMPYQRGSVMQRLELLRGLMDTDGHCNTRGTATFVNKNGRLAHDVHELATGLGLCPTIREYAADHGLFWQVSFQAYQDKCPFRIKRKADRVKPGRRVNNRRFIVSVNEIEPSPMSCIQVDRKDGLYLAGRQMVTTHNSTIITFAGIIQEVLIDPEITVGIFSHTKSLGEEFLSQIKQEFETNELLQKAYSDVLYEAPHKQSPRWSVDGGLVVKRKTNPKEATVEAWGLTKGMPTGKHFALRVYDDIVTKDSVTNPEMVKKTTESWELSDNLGAGEGRKWHIGTRYSFNDTYGVIFERGALTPRLYAATDNGKLDGKPVLISEKRWKEKKNLQRSTVSAQMLQNPIAGNENMFRPQWFRSYEVRPSILNVYIMGDPSKGSRSTSDRTAIAVVGVDLHSNKYLLDGFRHRMSMSERWQCLKMLHKKWTKVPGIQMVRVGWERFGQQTDDEYFAERMREENYSFELIELAWPRDGTQSKKDRVERLEPDFRGGRFFLPAVVREKGKGSRGESADCLWSIDLDKSHIETRVIENGKMPREMARMTAGGKAHLVAKAISRIDEDRNPYDLTRCLIEEMMFFPFAPKDDLVDAVSRIYDMEPIPPSFREDAIAADLNGATYEDA